MLLLCIAVGGAIGAVFRERGFAGTTVLRGISGFGASAKVHTDRILRLSLDLPIGVEVVETEKRIQAARPVDLTHAAG